MHAGRATNAQLHDMKTLFVPDGPKNLASLFPSINWRDVEQYYIELLDQSDNVLATTSDNWIEVCSDDVVRVHFINRLGTVDAINMKLKERESESKSSVWSKSPVPGAPKSQHFQSRFSVTGSTDMEAVSARYGEEAMAWLEELLDTPMAWVEWKGTEGQPDDYLPIIILDQSLETLKDEDRYLYEVKTKFTYSHTRKTIRN